MKAIGSEGFGSQGILEAQSSDSELSVSMGAHARIDLRPRGAGVGELVAS